MIKCICLQDQIPEADERFLVNITRVTVVGMVPGPGSEPSIVMPGNIAVVTIKENDNARGIIQFDVKTVSYNSLQTGIIFCKFLVSLYITPFHNISNWFYYVHKVTNDTTQQ